MSRTFTGGKLVIATHNPGKLREIGELLEPFGAQVVSAGELGLPEPVEDGDDFLANALIKSRAAALASGLPALADDSGLVVDALDGEPGIHSARWGGPDKDFTLAMTRVLDELGARADRSAHFACALSLCWPDGHHEDFLGRVHGTITHDMRGTKGFGYDPIFIADGRTITFGEMDPAEKHSISHRADAFRQLVAACFTP